MALRRVKILSDETRWEMAELPEEWTLDDGTKLRVDPGTEPTIPEGRRVVSKKTMEVVDEEYESDRGWTTRRSVLERVVSKMGKTLPASDEEIEKFVDDFSKLSLEDRIRYGEWGPDTFEGKVQALLEQGVLFEEAVERVRSGG